jgi:hypothetical protein
MKRLIPILFVLISCVSGYSQNSLSVTAVNAQWPDSILVNTTTSFIAVLQNDSSGIYVDDITLFFGIEVGVLTTIIDSFNLGINTILTSDTVSFAVIHTFSNTKYAPGNNVVVIWPVNGAGEPGDTLELNVFVIYPSDLPKINLLDHITAYPNPFHGELSIKSLLTEKEISYNIYSASGALVKSGYVDQATVDVSSLAKGVYSLEVYTANARASMVLIKN